MFNKSKNSRLTRRLLADVEQYLKERYVPEEEAVDAAPDIDELLAMDGLVLPMEEATGTEAPEASEEVSEAEDAAAEFAEALEKELPLYEEDFGDTVVMDAQTYYNAMKHLGTEPKQTVHEPLDVFKRPASAQSPMMSGGGLDAIIDRAGETFTQSLLRQIDAKGYKDADIYKRADVDRRLFSKIRSNMDYQPRKQTALALALALKLNLDEAVDLISRAGYALSPSSVSDLIVQYCIEHGMYDLADVNALLYNYDQPALGGRLG
ncbi:MAG: hypothetical protein IJH91_07640 [Mogibacterium sp.]|nr:hypothetical protein [Mogibacterium sp.]